MIKHPTLSPEAIEDIQRWCFERGFPAARPEHLPRPGSALARLPEAQELAQSAACARRPSITPGSCGRPTRCFSPGRLLGPNAAVRRWIGDLERRIHAELGRPALGERLKSVLAVGAALWTGLTLKLDLFQHPKLMRTTYRMPGQALGRVRSVGGTPSQDRDPQSLHPGRAAARQTAGVDAAGRQRCPQPRPRVWGSASVIPWRGARAAWCWT